MPNYITSYWRCPNCKKKGVSLRISEVVSEDHYGCRYCDWFAFVGGPSRRARNERDRLRAANPSDIELDELD